MNEHTVYEFLNFADRYCLPHKDLLTKIEKALLLLGVYTYDKTKPYSGLTKLIPQYEEQIVFLIKTGVVK